VSPQCGTCTSEEDVRSFPNTTEPGARNCLPWMQFDSPCHLTGHNHSVIVSEEL
jgi:hypothetical protein